MKGFNRWLESVRPLLPYYAALNGRGVIDITAAPGGFNFPRLTAADRVPPGWCDPGDWQDFLGYVCDRRDSGSSLYGGVWAVAGFAADGPKVYRPTEAEFLALSQVELAIPWAAYRQPFPAFAVVLPDALTAQYSTAGVGNAAGIIGRLHGSEPLAAVCVVGDEPGNIASGAYSWDGLSDEPMEDYFRVTDREYGRVPATDAERYDAVRRAFVNACLLLTQYGHRSLGKSNPEYAARLEASLKKKGLPEAVRRANRAALHALPELIGFDQHVRVYDHAGDAHAATGERGEVRPHWRRGHWANVACGKGHAERRLVFRRPVLVHADRFAGCPADTRVTLTTAR